MFNRKAVAAGIAALAMAASSTVALAQATGKENNATSGSSAGAGPNSGPEVKGSTETGAKPSGSSEMKGHETTAGTSKDQAEDLRGHSETPKDGSSK